MLALDIEWIPSMLASLMKINMMLFFRVRIFFL